MEVLTRLAQVNASLVIETLSLRAQI